MKKTIAVLVCLLTVVSLCGCAAYQSERMFDKFIEGTVTATDQQGGSISVDLLKDQAIPLFGGEYIFFDVTGDKIPELCVRTAQHLTLFTRNDDHLHCLRELPATTTLLNDGAILLVRSDAVLGTSEHTYVKLNKQGQDEQTITFSADPVGNQYTYNGKTVTKEEYETATKDILASKIDQSEWTPLEKK